MSSKSTEVINEIVVFNNRYRDPSTHIDEKVMALWEIGNILFLMDVDKPHTLGWAIQRETRGLIKRLTIVRSFKIRLIWESKDLLKRDIGCLTSLSIFTEMIPLIDPRQKVRNQLSNSQLQDIYNHACHDTPGDFKTYIKKIKQHYSHGRLGKALDRSKHLKALDSIVNELKDFADYLTNIIDRQDPGERELFRSNTSIDERVAFSNMCISLTTKDNLRLNKKLGPPRSTSKDERFSRLYNTFYDLLDKKADDERARLRRRVSPEALSQLSDIVSSLSSEESVKDYLYRQKISILIN